MVLKNNHYKSGVGETRRKERAINILYDTVVDAVRKPLPDNTELQNAII